MTRESKKHVRSVLPRSVLSLIILILFLPSCGGTGGGSSSPDELVSLSGYISGPVQAGIPVQATREGGQTENTATDEQGHFSFLLPPGWYTLRPSLDGCIFDPESHSLWLDMDSGLEFISTLRGYTLSGAVQGSIREGVKLTLEGQDITGEKVSRVTTSRSNGTFEFSSLHSGIYTITPYHATCSFAPAHKVITVIGTSDVSDIRFEAHGPGVLVKWKLNTDGEIYSSPALDHDGTIYAGSYDDNLYAINPDGSIKWTFPFQGDIFASPAIDRTNGTIYLASTNGCLYALSPHGYQKWHTSLGGGIYSTAAIGQDGTIFIGCNDHFLYALDPATGQEKWATLLCNIVSSPALGPDGTIYVGASSLSNNDGLLYAIDPEDGDIIWTAGIPTFSRPAIGPDGTIYLGSLDQNVYALRPGHGTVKWSYQTGGRIFSSPVLGADGTIYIGSDDTRVYALTSQGALKWASVTGAEVRSSACLGPDQTVYIGSRDCYLYALDPATGARKWRFLTEGGAVTCIPAAGEDGLIYFGSQNGSFYALYSH